MARNIFFRWNEYYRFMDLLEKREKLFGAFKEWNGTPRLAEGYSLPWPPYIRHDWYSLYTHFLYYPFRAFKEFAAVYGLNYKSSQTWINQHILPGINGDWKGSKNRWLMKTLEDNNVEVIAALHNPDEYVSKYRPLSAK